MRFYISGFELYIYIYNIYIPVYIYNYVIKDDGDSEYEVLEVIEVPLEVISVSRSFFSLSNKKTAGETFVNVFYYVCVVGGKCMWYTDVKYVYIYTVYVHYIHICILIMEDEVLFQQAESIRRRFSDYFVFCVAGRGEC